MSDKKKSENQEADREIIENLDLLLNFDLMQEPGETMELLEDLNESAMQDEEAE